MVIQLVIQVIIQVVIQVALLFTLYFSYTPYIALYKKISNLAREIYVGKSFYGPEVS